MTERHATPEISVVIPFFDEQENVAPLLDELVPVLDELDRTFEILCVDDGSRDDTWGALLQAAGRHGPIRPIHFTHNNGQTAALDAGFRASRGEYVVTLDGDLQIDPRDIGPMLDELERTGVDLVCGWRRDRRDDGLKRLSTKVANAVRNRLTGVHVHDTGCPLKVFRAEVVRRLPLFDGMHRFFVELARMQGFRTAERVVRHRPRTRGTSKYGVFNRVFKALGDCLVVRRMLVGRLRYEIAAEPRNDSGRSTGVPAPVEVANEAAADPLGRAQNERREQS